MSFSIVVATDEKGGIGKNNKLLWNIPSDLKRFKDITTKHQDCDNNAVIMGVKTFNSIGRVLPSRDNIIISRSYFYDKKPMICGNFFRIENFNNTQLVSYYKDIRYVVDNYKNSDKEYFIIGGESIYKQFLPYVYKIYLTEVKGDFGADRFFKYNKDEFIVTYCGEWQKENGYEFRFLELERM